jgi:hypothetical protein
LNYDPDVPVRPQPHLVLTSGVISATWPENQKDMEFVFDQFWELEGEVHYSKNKIIPSDCLELVSPMEAEP